MIYPPIQITFREVHPPMLIVEENPMFLKFYSEHLSRLGFSFISASNYMEAPNFFIAARPKLVIFGSCVCDEQRLNFAREIADLEPKCKMILLWPKNDALQIAEEIGFDLILSREISQDRFLEDLLALT
jgi:DNA-binding NtrC family response regulator